MNQIHDSYVEQGAGKTNATLRWIADNHEKIPCAAGPKRTGIVYVTTREEVENLDITRFMTNFGPHQSKARLRRLHGQILFTVSGYDETAIDLFEIEEVRKFYSVLDKIWPCWLFASSLLSTNLRALALCVIPNMSLQRSEQECRIRLEQVDLITFFENSLAATALLHHRSGIGKQAGVKHLKAVAAHLGLPNTP